MNRQLHQAEVLAFLQETFSLRDWTLTLPEGSGNETYFAQAEGQSYFVKVGAELERARIMAEAGLTPPLRASAKLSDGIQVIVQPYIEGRKPTRRDLQERLEQAAILVREMHSNSALRDILPPVSHNSYQEAARIALARLKERWEQYKALVPEVAGFVDESLNYLDSQIDRIKGAGLVASHNDICNANWLLTTAGRFYLIDLESMSREDPAFDLGALLWWYYPPYMRKRFLEIAGYNDDPEFQTRMWLRMALHSLSITLPRPNSFDRFEPASYKAALTDFRAIVQRQENPQGY